ncbi:MAG: type II secretion system F family protein [Planctomycetota bacterium]
MATYRYNARRLDGTVVEGSVPAESEQAALAALDREGLFPIRLEPLEGAKRGRSGARIGAEVAARFARQLADLTESGVPLLQALDSLVRPPEATDVVWGGQRSSSDEDRARTLLGELRRDIAQGMALAQALEKRPELFGTTAIALVRAGEAGGFLGQALRRVADFAEREHALNRKVRSALAYPALLGLLSAGAVAFLLAWVVPRFASIYADLGGSLPLPTRMLLWISGALQSGGWVLIVLGIGAVLWIRSALETEEGRTARDRILIRVPGVRGVVAQAALARYSQTLGTLLSCGVDVLASLEIAAQAAGNLVFTQGLLPVVERVRGGMEVAPALAETRLIPPQTVEVVGVGQQSGTLAEVLERVGERADVEVDRALTAFVTAFEPLLIVSVAAVVFFVVLAALLPVFTLNTLVH